MNEMDLVFHFFEISDVPDEEKPLPVLQKSESEQTMEVKVHLTKTIIK